MRSTNSAGELLAASVASARSRCRTSGSCIAARASASSRFTISFGVFLGTKRPVQKTASAPAIPASAMVGTSGNSESLPGDVTASARNRRIAGDYRDRDSDCSRATSLNRPGAKQRIRLATASKIGSDSGQPLLPKLAHQDCWLSERLSFHNIANQRSSLVCALRRENRVGSIQPPVP